MRSLYLCICFFALLRSKIEMVDVFSIELPSQLQKRFSITWFFLKAALACTFLGSQDLL